MMLAKFTCYVRDLSHLPLTQNALPNVVSWFPDYPCVELPLETGFIRGDPRHGINGNFQALRLRLRQVHARAPLSDRSVQTLSAAVLWCQSGSIDSPKFYVLIALRVMAYIA